MTDRVLQAETEASRGSGAISAENRSLGFRPAFLDTCTGAIYVSRYADGRPAPFHVLDGLPDELVVERSASGRVSAVKACIVSGFVFDGRFYTREEAARRAAGLTARQERRLT
jgi:hypothetical protein